MRTIEEVTRDIVEAQNNSAGFESIIKPLYAERSEIIKHNRDKWDDDNYFIEIDCPVHLSHEVKLFTYGHRYAGIWECDETGVSDACPHYDVGPEVTEDYEGAPAKIMVCTLCGVAVEDEDD